MADSTLNITVKTDSKELQALVDRLNKGEVTVAQFNKEMRAMKQSAILGSQGLMDLKSVTAQVGDATATANGKMMKSYFTLGEELRRYYMSQRVSNRTMSEVTQTASQLGGMLGAGGLGSIVATAAQGFEQMEFAVSAAGIATKRLGGSIGEIGGKLLSMAGPLAGIAAGVGVLTLALTEQKKITDELNKSLEKGTELMIAGGKISKETQIEMLKRQLGQVGREGIAAGFIPSLLGKRSMMEDLMRQASDQANKAQEIQNKINGLLGDGNKLEHERIIALEEIYDWDTKDAKVQEEQVEEKKAIAQWQSTIAKSAREYQDAFLGKAFNRQPGKTKLGGVGLQGLPGVNIAQPIEEGISQAQIAVNSLTDSMQSGFQEATSYLAQGFAQAFGLGNSLLDRMISTFATSALTSLPGMIANLLTAGATGNIFTALGALLFDSGGTITEPVAGVGMKSGRPYQIAWNGQPERISPINSVGQAGRYGSQSGQSNERFIQAIGTVLNNSRLQAKGHDMVLVYDGAKRSQSERLY